MFTFSFTNESNISPKKSLTQPDVIPNLNNVHFLLEANTPLKYQNKQTNIQKKKTKKKTVLHNILSKPIQSQNKSCTCVLKLIYAVYQYVQFRG